jgi:hypothetical protein
MKISKFWVLGFAVWVIIGCLIFSTANAQDMSIWIGEWFKVTETEKGYDASNSGIATENGSAVKYLKVEGWNPDTKVLQVVMYKLHDEGLEVFPLDLYYIGGNNLEFLIGSQGTQSQGMNAEMSFGITAYFKGKMRGQVLISASLKTLGGYKWSYDYTGGTAWAGGWAITGSLIPESKLPPYIPK